ncbi:hypothetical protein K493DRAFT_310346 [Basidiobolus meristosporus CBS 931.73]|uniref:Uncharacterized protein n=1 Tax=Basidiobolus meristosporus CBS 931.73 TaxID=1314790 RepID=A0A1Y1ZBI4_9FUNG|nr:hypothetical protein K493DRAFT_310346 [Basidiobolus meristosporus CBS 931.73]|eukprot:ORY07125.1 hypothetical protein K493DRAFT_310346 [Basidiobolus meristosporus CBS 931.73]
MPVIEAIGGVIGVAIFCSVIVRRVRIKKRQQRANKETKALWKRRKFVYGSPQVIRDSINTPFSNTDTEPPIATVNYYPSASAVVTPNIILPPIHFRGDNVFCSYPSTVPVSPIPPLPNQQIDQYPVQSINGSIEGRENDVELEDLSPPAPTTPNLYEEIPSAPSLEVPEFAENDFPELPASPSSRQKPSAPALDDLELTAASVTTSTPGRSTE